MVIGKMKALRRRLRLWTTNHPVGAAAFIAILWAVYFFFVFPWGSNPGLPRLYALVSGIAVIFPGCYMVFRRRQGPPQGKNDITEGS